MAIYALGDQVPEIHPDAYVHPDAVVIGSVRIGARSSIWPTAVLRGDDGEIIVGEETSIQDGSILHTTPVWATRLGNRVTVGHNAHLEACTIEDRALVGSGSIVLHNAVVGAEAIVGAGAFVGNNKVVPPLALAVGIDEGRFGRLGESRLTCGGESRNLVATIEPEGPVTRTVCLVSHLDSSRSGLTFSPAVTPHLGLLAGLAGVALGLQALDPVLGRARAGRAVVRLSRLVCGLAAALIVEREIRGEDVPGANDNASGAAVSAVLATEVARSPLERTRLVLLVTGSEESGVLGMRSFLRGNDTRGWLFLNFDGVGGEAPLRYLEREGNAVQSWPADSGILDLMSRIERERPELELSSLRLGSGLPYDSTPVLVRGGRAATLSVQGQSIPDYHAPTDTADRISDQSLGRAIQVGRELIAAIDRGEADRPQ